MGMQPLRDVLAFGRIRFLLALLLANFVVVPLLVATPMQFLLLPAEPMVRLGVLLVLFMPCIDYVVTFSHMGRADARLLLVATPRTSGCADVPVAGLSRDVPWR